MVDVRRFYKLLTLACIALAGTAIAGCQIGLKKQPAPDFGDYRIIGYVNTDTDIRQIDPHKLTHINFAFARLDSTGAIYFRSAGSEAYLAQLTALRNRNPSLQIVLSIGGWGADYFSDVALNDTSRRDFAMKVVDLVRAHDLDGVDLDWEYPGQPGPGIKYRPEDKLNFTLLLQTVRQHLDLAGAEDGRDYILTIASSGSQRYFANTQMDVLHAYLDFINVMAYDFYTAGSGKTGHHAGLFKSSYTDDTDRNADDAVRRHLEAGIPADKVVLGVAFYGRGWTQVSKTNSGLYQSAGRPTRAYTYRELTTDYINKRSFDLYW
ncbi:MAG: glycosyl hydrolase family 18 protein, partial [Bacteroidota bacterium]